MAALLTLLSVAAAVWCLQHGYTLYYGDAQAHINIARRVVDSRTPGHEQLGTVWLPLPHVLTLPFVTKLAWWKSGLAGAIPSMLAYVAAGLCAWLAAYRLHEDKRSAWIAFVIVALNPNVLYLQATPMTEPLQMASTLGVFLAVVSYWRAPRLSTAAYGGVAILAGTLTRYESWFLIPFAALAFLLLPGPRWKAAAVFCAVAAMGPLYWLAHNRYYYLDPLEFYHGPYSAKAIYQRALDARMERYPGDGDWLKAIQYYGNAVWLNAPVVILAVAGFVRRQRLTWLLAVPVVFYVMSLHGSGTPIFAPNVYPFSYYNTRYGLAALPLIAMMAAAIPSRWILMAAAAISLWPATPITWKESQVNSEARRQWTQGAAEFLRKNYRPGTGIIIGFGDLAGVLAAADLPLREALHEGNGPAWQGAVQTPQAFLFEEWALAQAGDPVHQALVRSNGPRYRCVWRMAIRNEPVVEIWRRDQARIGLNDEIVEAEHVRRHGLADAEDDIMDERR